MNLKKMICRILPVFRVRDSLNAELYYIQQQNNATQQEMRQQMRNLKQQVENLEKKNEYLFYCLNRREEETLLETKERVFRNLPKYGGELSECQAKEKYILERVNQKCRENGLSIILAYGTLLGAVRHEGFIPWDDDVDILMDYESYCQLEELLENDEELTMSRYYRMWAGSIPGYITKIKLKNSDCYFVDVFTFDYLRVGERDPDVVFQETVEMNEQYHRELGTLFLKYNIDPAVIFPAKVPEEMDREVRELEKEYAEEFRSRFRTAGEPDYFCVSITEEACVRRRGLHLLSESFPLVEAGVTFEGKKYCKFRNSEELLKENYGEYMELPSNIYPSHSVERKMKIEK